VTTTDSTTAKAIPCTRVLERLIHVGRRKCDAGSPVMWRRPRDDHRLFFFPQNDN